jgi:hypothetical protein
MALSRVNLYLYVIIIIIIIIILELSLTPLHEDVLGTGGSHVFKLAIR